MSNDSKHHAYFIEGDGTLGEALTLIEEKFNFSRKGNPDFFLLEKETAGIEDTRFLKERSFMKALQEEKFLFLYCRFITTEAQNSLLKLFEDPPENTLLFLFGVPKGALLPTLESRLSILSLVGKAPIYEAEKFLSLSVSERIKYVSRFSSKEAKETKEEKIKSEFYDFLSGLEKVLKKRLVENSKEEKLPQKLRDILECKRFVLTRSPSLKMMGEYLSVIL
ncbi:MAG: hypothetical protein AAB545_03335 [Patescibacteria group bacterium]